MTQTVSMSYLSASRPKRVALVIAGVAMIAIGYGGVGVTSTTRNTGRRSGPLDMSNLVVGVDGVKLSLTTKAQLTEKIGKDGVKLTLKNDQLTVGAKNVHSGDKLTVTANVLNLGDKQYTGTFAYANTFADAFSEKDDKHEHVNIHVRDTNGENPTLQSIRFDEIKSISIIDEHDAQHDMSNLVVGVDGVKLSLTTKAQTLTLITPTGNQVIPLRSGSANMRQQLELLGMMAGDKLTVTKKRNGKGPTTTWFGNFDRLDDTNVYIWTDRAHSEVHHMHIAFDDILSIHLERTADARAAEAFFLGTEHDGAAAASPASFTPKSRMHDKYDADTLLLHTKHD